MSFSFHRNFLLLPLQIPTKLDATPIYVRLWNGGSSSLVRRQSEGVAKVERRIRRVEEEEEKSNRRATEEQDKRQTPPKSAFGKNFFVKTLHPYTSTPHIALTINTLQRFQISLNPTPTLHQPYTIKRISHTLSTTCSASKYFPALIYIIFAISLGYFRKFS